MVRAQAPNLRAALVVVAGALRAGRGYTECTHSCVSCASLMYRPPRTPVTKANSLARHEHPFFLCCVSDT